MEERKITIKFKSMGGCPVSVETFAEVSELELIVGISALVEALEKIKGLEHNTIASAFEKRSSDDKHKFDDDKEDLL